MKMMLDYAFIKKGRSSYAHLSLSLFTLSLSLITVPSSHLCDCLRRTRPPRSCLRSRPTIVVRLHSSCVVVLLHFSSATAVVRFTRAFVATAAMPLEKVDVAHWESGSDGNADVFVRLFIPSVLEKGKKGLALLTELITLFKTSKPGTEHHRDVAGASLIALRRYSGTASSWLFTRTKDKLDGWMGERGEGLLNALKAVLRLEFYKLLGIGHVHLLVDKIS